MNKNVKDMAQQESFSRIRDASGRLSDLETKEYPFLKLDGSTPLSAEWDIGEDMAIRAERIEARDGEGLRLEDDGGNLGIFIEDGGNVGINTSNPSEKLHISEGVLRISRDSSGGPGYFEFEETQVGGKIGKFDIFGGIMRFGERFVSNILGIDLANKRVGVATMAPAGKLHVDQDSTTAAIPVLILDQADVSEEFIEFTATVGAGNPIDTAALGTYYGKVRVMVTGVGFKNIALYNP